MYRYQQQRSQTTLTNLLIFQLKLKMNRFGNVSESKINAAVENSVPLNTQKTHTSIWKQFMEFCQAKNYQLLQTTTTGELNLILKDWAWNMRKTNGEDYKELCVKVMWNIVAKKLQEKYFQEFNIVFDPFHDITFKPARDARNAKRRSLQKHEEKRKTSSASLNMDDYYKMVSLWDESTPTGLQRKFYFIAAVELAWRGGEAARCLTEHFKEEIDNYGIKTGEILLFNFATKSINVYCNLAEKTLISKQNMCAYFLSWRKICFRNFLMSFLQYLV